MNDLNILLGKFAEIIQRCLQVCGAGFFSRVECAEMNKLAVLCDVSRKSSATSPHTFWENFPRRAASISLIGAIIARAQIVPSIVQTVVIFVINLRWLQSGLHFADYLVGIARRSINLDNEIFQFSARGYVSGTLPREPRIERFVVSRSPRKHARFWRIIEDFAKVRLRWQFSLQSKSPSPLLIQQCIARAAI